MQLKYIELDEIKTAVSKMAENKAIELDHLLDLLLKYEYFIE